MICSSQLLLLCNSVGAASKSRERIFYVAASYFRQFIGKCLNDAHVYLRLFNSTAIIIKYCYLVVGLRLGRWEIKPRFIEILMVFIPAELFVILVLEDICLSGGDWTGSHGSYNLSLGLTVDGVDFSEIWLRSVVLARLLYSARATKKTNTSTKKQKVGLHNNLICNGIRKLLYVYQLECWKIKLEYLIFRAIYFMNQSSRNYLFFLKLRCLYF